LPGALEAVRALRAADYPIRFVTNTTSLAPRALADHLRDLGMLRDPAELYTPFSTARQALTQRDASAGILIATPEQRAELAWFEERESGPSVLLASEAHDLTIAQLQPAFRALLNGANLYAMEMNRFFKKGSQLLTDLGPVAAFLQYASHAEAQVLGKPSRLLFETLAREVGVELKQLVMVGDDAEVDVAQCIALGLRGVLIRSGKFRPGDETRYDPRPSAILTNLAELPGWLARG
jgi:HAD superfamily hydrolase (TIGR01458 family)